MPNFTLNAAQTQRLLQSLAQQLGCDPSALQQQLSQGDLRAVDASLGADGAAQLRRLLHDPKQLSQAVNSPEMQELLRRLQQN